jgi:hypothetical protein
MVKQPARPWVSVIETRAYLARAEKILSEEERANLVEMVARAPECGDVMVGTGGVRKVRFALEGRGQSGGARVVYFFHNEDSPLFLLTVFGKNEKANLSKAERNQLAKLTAILKREITKEKTP